MTFQMMQDLAKLATSEKENGKKISNKELKLIIKHIFKTEQRPEKNISLDFEHSLSISALKNLQLSLKSFYKIVIKVAKEFYPNNYHEIHPQILRLHTWVGYDVDGRGDIFWNNTFSKRLKVKIEQLKIYLNSISNLLKKSKNNLSQKRISFLKKIEVAIQINEKVLKSFSKDDFLESPDEFKKFQTLCLKRKMILLQTRI